MKFFQECNSLDEVKTRYRTLAKENHPDKGGDLETMQAINKEYAFACANIAQGQTSWTAEEVDAAILAAEEYRQAVEKLSILPTDVKVELIGAWLWVSGNTRPHSDFLKSEQNGPRFWWAHKKGMWYFRGSQYKVSTRGHSMSMDQIKRKYGSQQINRKSKTTLDE